MSKKGGAVVEQYYENKGMVRHGVFLTKEAREMLKSKSKDLKITQGELISLLVDNVDMLLPHVASDLSALQAIKEQERASANNQRKAAYKHKAVVDLDTLPDDLREQLEAAIAKQ